MNYRQIHLDFHTSEHIPNIAKDFVKEEFASTLEEASVDSITCFARCHHGWLYYPSKKHPELIHPHLDNKNFLLEQIEGCHNKGIKVPIYTTAQWDAVVMREHPEWLSVGEDGKPIDTQQIGDPHFYFTICLNSAYREFFKDHIIDIFDVVGSDNVDGIFMDILFQVDCNCTICKGKMNDLKMDTTNKIERLKYASMMLNDFKTEISALIKKLGPNATIFYNSSHVGPAHKESYEHYSHLELESLPSGGWGYDHFPSTSRYARTLGKDMIGMTGKFHTYWGDFHSLKNLPALELECFQMLAFGAGCSIGDQLHPYGKLSTGSYDLIGSVYKSVKEKEPYCKGYRAESEIAVLNPEEFYVEGYNTGISKALIGTVRMLQELSYQFDIIDSKQDLTAYSLVILPDIIYYTPELDAVMKNYISKGGKVIGSYDSCLDKKATDNIYGVEFVGKSPYYREFVMPNDVICKNLSKEEYVLYLEGYDVAPTHCQVLMDKIKPFFNREGDTFCSHQHAPSSGEKTHPAITRNGDVIYFSHPIFELYRKNAASWCKEMVKDSIELLLENKLVTHNGPSTVITSYNRKENKSVLHILHYITEKKSEDIYTVSDVIPLYHNDYKLFVGDKIVKAVTLVPENREMKFVKKASEIEFTIDEIKGHAMVLIEFE